MRLAHQFQGQTVKGQGYRLAGAYRVGRTRRPHCLLLMLSAVNLYFYSKHLTNSSWMSGDCVCVQLSQILGHSDQLYTKLPRGLRVWQYSNAIAVTGLAAAVSPRLSSVFELSG